MKLANPLSTFRGDYRYVSKRIDVACLSTDAIGDPVCIRGDRVNGKWRVEAANPQDGDKMPAIGVLVDKSTPTVGVVQLFGPVEDVFIGMTPGAYYFVGTSGVADVAPSAGSLGYVDVQHIGFAVAEDILLLTGDLMLIRERG